MEFEIGSSVAQDIEELFKTHPEVCEDYFVKNADMNLINRWLKCHGFMSLQELIDQKERSLSNESDDVDPLSPREPKSADSFFSKHVRSNSKKYLRHDFAKSKYRNMFRTYEPTPTCQSESTSTDSRRGSLKEMRMFRSLPPNSSNMLSILIESKVRLPRYPSKDIDKKRELRYRNEREFFMEIVKDISNDLDLGSLSSKIISNLCVLSEADQSSIFVVEGKNNNQPSLVSKIFDVHCGTHILPSKNADNCIRVPWGKGIIGYVAQTGEAVNLQNASQVRDILLKYYFSHIMRKPVFGGVRPVKPLNGLSAKEDRKSLAVCGIKI